MAIAVAILITSLLFGTGAILFGEYTQADIWLVLAIILGFAAIVNLRKFFKPATT